MSKATWLNANETRAFPFLSSRSLRMSKFINGECCPLDDPVDLPDQTIVDFGCLMHADARYDDANNYIYLHKICRTGDTFEFEFSSNNPQVQTLPLSFTRTLGDPEFAADWQESSAGGFPSPCGDQIIWEGYLVTGQLTDLADLLADGDSLLGDERIRVEPALIQNDVRGATLRSISVAGYTQTTHVAPEDCEYWFPPIDEEFRSNAGCMRDHIRFTAGYNATLRYDPYTATFTFGAAVGAGLGEPCGETKRYAAQIKPTHSNLYSGGYSCAEVVKAINGLVGPHVRVKGRNGVIVSQTEDGALLVRFAPETAVTGCEGA